MTERSFLRLKFPKRIKIASVVYKVKWNKKRNGAEFSCNPKKAFIEIGLEWYTKGNLLYTLGVIIHELKEIIQVNQGTRIRKELSDDVIFLSDHVQHTDFCDQLAGLLGEFIE